MAKLKYLIIAFTISAVSGFLVFLLAFYCIINLFPPVDSEVHHHMAFGQIAVSGFISFIYVISMTIFVYNKIKKKHKLSNINAVRLVPPGQVELKDEDDL